MSLCFNFPYGRFNNSNTNFKIFPKTLSECSPKPSPQYVLDPNGKWLING